MLKRNPALRIAAYILTGIGLIVGGSLVIGFVTTWLIPDQFVRWIVAFVAGMPLGWVVGTWLTRRYIRLYW